MGLWYGSEITSLQCFLTHPPFSREISSGFTRFSPSSSPDCSVPLFWSIGPTGGAEQALNWHQKRAVKGEHPALRRRRGRGDRGSRAVYAHLLALCGRCTRDWMIGLESATINLINTTICHNALRKFGNKNVLKRYCMTNDIMPFYLGHWKEQIYINLSTPNITKAISC